MRRRGAVAEWTTLAKQEPQPQERCRDDQATTSDIGGERARAWSAWYRRRSMWTDDSCWKYSEGDYCYITRTT